MCSGGYGGYNPPPGPPPGGYSPSYAPPPGPPGYVLFAHTSPGKNLRI